MKILKRFNELFEKAEEAVQLKSLITDDGNEIVIDGYYEPGVGIFDYDGNEYPIGVGIDGTVYKNEN